MNTWTRIMTIGVLIGAAFLAIPRANAMSKENFVLLNQAKENAALELAELQSIHKDQVKSTQAQDDSNSPAQVKTEVEVSSDEAVARK